MGFLCLHKVHILLRDFYVSINKYLIELRYTINPNKEERNFLFKSLKTKNKIIRNFIYHNLKMIYL